MMSLMPFVEIAAVLNVAIFILAEL